MRTRVTPLYINRGYTDEDEITYKLPPGYKLEDRPLRLFLEKPFGSFTAVMILNGDKLTFKRKLQLVDGTYSKDLYNELVEFYHSISEADNYNVALIKN